MILILLLTKPFCYYSVKKLCCVFFLGYLIQFRDIAVNFRDDKEVQKCFGKSELVKLVNWVPNVPVDCTEGAKQTYRISFTSPLMQLNSNWY